MSDRCGEKEKHSENGKESEREGLKRDGARKRERKRKKPLLFHSSPKESYCRNELGTEWHQHNRNTRMGHNQKKSESDGGYKYSWKNRQKKESKRGTPKPKNANSDTFWASLPVWANNSAKCCTQITFRNMFQQRTFEQFLLITFASKCFNELRLLLIIPVNTPHCSSLSTFHLSPCFLAYQQFAMPMPYIPDPSPVFFVCVCKNALCCSVWSRSRVERNEWMPCHTKALDRNSRYTLSVEY